MDPVITIRGLTKRYAGGGVALDDVDLEIRRGEIFALLGPNGAGKTTLISAVCGTVTTTAGTVLIDGHDHQRDWRRARARVGLVPQEMPTDAFTSVLNTMRLSRGLFGLAPNEPHLAAVLKDLSLWEKRDSPIMTLSGGMKRRVLIAKALAHEPAILFLDEPTAGVDVTLRRDMWTLVRRLRDAGTTVILTTHYLEEAQEMADRVGVIDKGRVVLVEEKARLMETLGRRRLTLELAEPLAAVPPALADWPLELSPGGRRLSYDFAAQSGEGSIPRLLRALDAAGVHYVDLDTRRSSLEEIFVDLVGGHG